MLKLKGFVTKRFFNFRRLRQEKPDVAAQAQRVNPRRLLLQQKVDGRLELGILRALSGREQRIDDQCGAAADVAVVLVPVVVPVVAGLDGIEMIDAGADGFFDLLDAGGAGGGD